MVSVNCGWCNKPIQVELSLYNMYHKRSEFPNFFCSRACQSEHKRNLFSGNNSPRWVNKVVFNCEYCGKETEQYPKKYNKYKNHFCSPECRVKSQIGRLSPKKERYTVACDFCGKEIERVKSTIYNKNFCSLKCKGVYFSGENHPFFNGWSSLKGYPEEFSNGFKEKIRNKFNRKCFICGIDEDDCKFKLSVHHIDYNKDNCDEDNLVPLCRHCHSKTNSNRTYWEKVINISRGKIE